jgi:hypothetical protein
MSPMFGAVFLWLLATIFWWSGWREEAVGSIPHWAAGVFLAVWPMAFLANVAITPSLSFNGAWIWTMAAIIALAWGIQSNRRWTSISAGVLLGCIYLLLSRLAFYPSGFTHFFAPWGTAIVVGWLSALLLRNAPEQFIAVSAGLYLSEGISALVMTVTDSIPGVHTSEWMECWWIAVLFARLWSVSVKSLAILARRWALKMGWRRGGQRS